MHAERAAHALKRKERTVTKCGPVTDETLGSKVKHRGLYFGRIEKKNERVLTIRCFSRGEKKTNKKKKEKELCQPARECKSDDRGHTWEKTTCNYERC